MPTAPTITIYVRHSEGCKYEADEFAKRCSCRKHLRWFQNGKLHRLKANTRSWDEAEEVKQKLKDQFSGRVVEAAPGDNTKDIPSCISLFLQDKGVKGIKEDVVAKHVRELGRLRDYCERQSVFVVQGITRELLTGFAATWKKQYPSTQTRDAVRTRLRAFLRYCYQAQWLSRIPDLPKIIVDEVPTMPLSDDEYKRLLAATKKLRTHETAVKAHALFQLMRWSGLSVRDALTAPKREIVKKGELYRVVTNREKTGTHVSVVIPPKVGEEILAVPNEGLFIFWDGSSDIVKSWTKYVIAPCFKLAKIERGGSMMSHRLRDTFAVNLLNKGVPMEEVSKALGHKSVKTTERYYAKWVKSRQDRLDNLIIDTW